MKRLAFPAVLLLLVAALGCGAQDVILGTERGYLFTGYDRLALPGEEVQLKTRIQAGDFLQDQPGLVVRYYHDGELYRATETNDEGVAQVAFTPEKPGDYIFRAEVSAVGLPDTPPKPLDILVACRESDAPMVVIDMDKTLVASGFHRVIAGDPEPMEGSVEVVSRLANRTTIVYLTHRPEYFGPKSKQWVRDNGYPRGPMLLSSVGGFVKGSRAFKSERLAQLGKRFKALEVGVGDKVGDALAYHENDLQAYLIPPIDYDDATADELRTWADEIYELPDAVQVVYGWDEVRRGIYQDEGFPPGRVVDRLRRLAEQREEEVEGEEEDEDEEAEE